MRDPLRIPELLAQLRETWEAQPDLSLPQLWARLEARGVALNSTDDELTAALADELTAHPGRLRFPSLAGDEADKARRETNAPPAATTPGVYLVDTESPSHTVTLHLHAPHSAWAIVRTPHLHSTRHRRQRAQRLARRTVGGGGEASGKEIPKHTTTIPPQPAVWQVAELTRCVTGAPLVLLDRNGTAHRFGVITRITALGPSGRPSTHSLPASPASLRGGLWALRSDDATIQLRGTRAEIWLMQRRELRYSSCEWEALEEAEADGRSVAALRCADGSVIELGGAQRLLRVE